MLLQGYRLRDKDLGYDGVTCRDLMRMYIWRFKC